ncbi:MAG: molybdenum cofactor guanylyltransferase [Proteobacteria bacterium]|nr:molybdenum cofactor guanylyltransferase [Pseudomonadota bacterium]MBU4469505.1 molybdenum cofactor guanylyltransferase [Pseudomonadota bacterium]MCG2753387.1 molybdenum cofactor guanylyltransferase [Desulfobacteraceae bacterium]
MTIPCSGVILAGGENKRFSGENKAFLEVGGKRVMDRIIEVFRQCFTEIIIVADQPEKYSEFDALIVTDLFTLRSSLTGLHAGLFYASNPFAFFSACDTPFLRKELIECVLAHTDPRYDAIMPETPGGLEPLCSAYSRQSLPVMERFIQGGKLKIQRVFSSKKLRRIPEARLRKADPDLVSFFNINSPSDLETAKDMNVFYSQPKGKDSA